MHLVIQHFVPLVLHHSSTPSVLELGEVHFQIVKFDDEAGKRERARIFYYDVIVSHFLGVGAKACTRTYSPVDQEDRDKVLWTANSAETDAQSFSVVLREHTGVSLSWEDGTPVNMYEYMMDMMFRTTPYWPGRHTGYNWAHPWPLPVHDVICG